VAVGTAGTCVLVGRGSGVALGGTGVFVAVVVGVGGTGVSVGGTAVAVAVGVAVGGTGVFVELGVGGTVVAVGGTAVGVGATGVAVGGTGWAAPASQPLTSRIIRHNKRADTTVRETFIASTP